MRQKSPYLLLPFALLLILLTSHPALAKEGSASTNSTPMQQHSATASSLTAATFDDATFDDEAEYDIHTQPTSDPLEGWNRFWFSFNDGLYLNVLKPAHKGYSTVTPSEFRTGVSNLFHHILFPIRFANALLQGKFADAGVETSRFILNTMGGFGGLMNPAADKKALIETSGDEEDLGQTLGAWGAGAGPYIVWPVLGPSSVRDSAGMFGDSFLNPASYITPWHSSVGVKAYGEFNTFDERLHQYEELTNSAIEPYTSVRNAYLQMREAKVNK